MGTQNITGQSTEQKVRNCLRSIGLESEKPRPDVGVDLEVWHPANSEKKVTLQVKGRGKTQKNGRYRWFQIRTTPKQRDEARDVSEAWKKKVDLCEFFVLVSEKHEEYWVFPKAIVHKIVESNKKIYGKRTDNNLGKQAEMDLDIEDNGESLTEIYKSYKNNFALISEALNNL